MRKLAMAPSMMSTSSEIAGIQTTRAVDLSAYLKRGCTLVAFLVPLKLSWTYVALIPLVLGWLFNAYRTRLDIGSVIDRAPALIPLALFVFTVFLGALFGMNPGHSLAPWVSLVFFTVTLLAFIQYGSAESIFPALVSGQSIAAIHSVMDSAFPGSVPPLFIGKVTESGQLALTFFVTLGLIWTSAEQLRAERNANNRRYIAWAGAVATMLFALVGFRADLQLSVLWSAIVIVAAIGVLTFGLVMKVQAKGEWKKFTALTVVSLPLLICALLVNLKRGPWFGVTIGCVIFFSLMAPRFLRWIFSAAVLATLTIGPIRDRLAASYEHFVISGGRSTIWRIGAELAAQFPLGVGFHNSEILRRFAPEIPPELRHFHNNLLNVTAENGWLATGIFIWFIAVLLRHSFLSPHNPLFVAIGCAIISWQSAGLVEYNVGDSEVLLIVWIIVGVLFHQLSESKSSGAAPISHKTEGERSPQV